jgi:hypothetical protein
MIQRLKTLRISNSQAIRQAREATIQQSLSKNAFTYSAGNLYPGKILSSGQSPMSFGNSTQVIFSKKKKDAMEWSMCIGSRGIYVPGKKGHAMTNYSKYIIVHGGMGDD